MNNCRYKRSDKYIKLYNNVFGISILKHREFKASFKIIIMADQLIRKRNIQVEPAHQVHRV